MFNNQLLDGLMAPPRAQPQPLLPPQVTNPVDGGYDWGKRGFQHAVPGGGTGAGHMGQSQPLMAPHNPVPQQGPTLQQMRAMMTQLHMQQMVNRLQKHANIHAGG